MELAGGMLNADCWSYCAPRYLLLTIYYLPVFYPVRLDRARCLANSAELI